VKLRLTRSSPGEKFGSTVETPAGERLLLFRPTYAQLIPSLPRQAQPIYPKDVGTILLWGDIHPGARVIEVGSGFSSLLMADIRRRFFPEGLEIQCIEPYPRDFLRDPAYGLELIESKVQDVPLSFFESLQANDVLFIDSSHVAKTGSDVNYLVFEILPRLPSGVNVHIHDIFLPHDYPFRWVVEENRSWNEQYLVQAYLMFNQRTKVLFGSAYANTVLVDETLKALDGKVQLSGGSLWFQTC